MDNSTQPDLAWFTAYIRFAWPTESEPQWHLDLVVGHEIVAPVLRRHLPQGSLWHFHRRAKRDSRGHEFALSFLTTSELAQTISAALQEHPLLKALRTADLIIEDTCEALESHPTPNNPPHAWHDWPSPVQTAWSHFIMGACQSWLALADTLLPKIQTDPSYDLNTILNQYQQLSNQISELWQKHGAHAFLHHLNAAYGYVPVRLGNAVIVF